MRTGIFGGTFDPVHNGHLICADAVRRQLALDKVVFVPAGVPPHKIARRITPPEDRLAMLRAAIGEREGFSVSDIECRRRKYTYTYDTLIELRRTAAADEEFYWIIGADTLADVFNWYRSADVFRLCAFAAMKRPGCDETVFQQSLRKAQEAGATVLVADVPQIDISATQIRAAAGAGEEIGAFVPEPVRAYIRQKNLYRPAQLHFSEIYEDVETLLSPRRFTHSIGVMEESVRLGERFGADREKCRLAGLLHDCAKELTEQQYRWLGIKTDASGEYDGKQVLLHGEAGAILAETRYGVRDPEILAAIRWHITGRPEMGLLEQILFVADYTEPGREGAVFDLVRETLRKGSLLRAVLAECESTIQYVVNGKDRQLCTQTVRTRNWALKKIAEEAEHVG